MNERASHCRRFWPLLLCAVVLGAIVVVRHWRFASARPPVQEVWREHLVLREGRWLLAGTTNRFTGLMIERRPDGALQARSQVSDGLLEGLSEGWHTNGIKQIEEHFHAGVSHGPRVKWHPNGQKLSEVQVVDGKLEGIFRRWHDNGQLAEEITLKAGQPEGLSRAFYPNGRLKAEATLHNGQPIKQQFYPETAPGAPAPAPPGPQPGPNL